MTDRLNDVGRSYETEINVEKTKVMGISIQASPAQMMDKQ
jgi:hypothetical protein